MKVSLDKEYKTAGNNQVKLFAIDEGGTDYPVFGKILFYGTWYCGQWSLDGQISGPVSKPDMRLVEVNNERFIWFAEFNNGAVSSPYESEREVRDCALARIKHIHRVPYALSEKTIVQG